MKDILITEEGRTLSKIHSGECISDALPYLTDYRNIFIVHDNAVNCHVQKIISHIPDCHCLGINASENDKNMDSVLSICEWLLERNADRYSLLLAIGGGITTDMAGFAAAIYKRGIRFAHIPTTLLSQVDAAIGGKTGVNFMGFKNMIGIIQQPLFTFECPDVLETLPYEDFVSGSAEMLKSFIIENIDNSYEKAVKTLTEIHGSANKAEAIKARRVELLELIHNAAQVKAGVVSRDQFEKGERKKLNLGHTFAHAIEKEADYSISHGKAVAIGMVMAAELSDRLGLSDGNLTARLHDDFQSCGLPTQCPFPKYTLAEAMSKDKKAENGTIHFVLMTHIGNVVINDMNVSEAL